MSDRREYAGPVVGGPASADHQMACLDRPWLSMVEVQKAPPVHAGGEPSPEAGTYQVHQYVWEPIRVNDSDIGFWRHSTLTVEQAIERLLSSYGDKRLRA